MHFKPCRYIEEGELQNFSLMPKTEFTDDAYLVTGIGELLWDRFPEFKLPGGAPANMAYHATIWGDHGVIASRIGMDDLGREIETYLWKKRVDTGYIQKDTRRPTGTVEVQMDEEEPVYSVAEDVAWDYLEMNEDWTDLARKSDAIVFGTLAQRYDQSRKTIQDFLDKSSARCLKVLDLNLRAFFYSKLLLEQCFIKSNVVKLNRDELNILRKLFSQLHPAEWLISEFNIDCVCVTLGSEGSEIYSPHGHIRRPTDPVDTSKGDAVGAGDAFTATLVHHLLRKRSYEETLKAANHYASRVATMKGGMPEINPHERS